MNEEEDEEYNNTILTPPEIREEADIARNTVLPEKSKRRYEIALEVFQKWQKENKVQNLHSENVLLAYFKQEAASKSPNTLWSVYSMLRSMINLQFKVDISKYTNLIALLKNKSKGYTPKKSKVFSDEHITQFLVEANDIDHLLTKVVLIFGILGACRMDEIKNVNQENMEEHKQMFLIKIPKTKTAVPRSFTISGQYYDIVKKYQELRPINTNTNRFFLNYKKAHCTRQVVGIHKLQKMPQEIAEFLKLKNSKEYTGHSFRRTSTTILANAGANTLTIKQHGGWKSSSVAETYVENSMYNKKKTENLIESRIDQQSTTSETSTTTSHESEIEDINDSNTINMSQINNNNNNVTIENNEIEQKNKKLENKYFSFNNCNNITINFQ